MVGQTFLSDPYMDKQECLSHQQGMVGQTFGEAIPLGPV